MFVIVAFLGVLTVLELSRLRLAWLESARAMNQMKDYLIQNIPQLSDCFRWKTTTIPEAFKPWSVGFLKALQVSALSGIALGSTCAFVCLSSLKASIPWLSSTLVALFTTFFYMCIFYYLPLKRIN
jgi:hypothetical protein